MRTRIMKGVLVLTAVTGVAAIPAVAQARHGADDAVRGHHQARHHHRHAGEDARGRGADDAPGHR